MAVYRHYLVSYIELVIRKIDTFGSGTSSSEIRLKTTLPQFCDLNRAVSRALTQYTSNCCFLTQCLYELKRDSRQNSSTLRQQEQMADTPRRNFTQQTTSNS